MRWNSRGRAVGSALGVVAIGLFIIGTMLLASVLGQALANLAKAVWG